MNVCFAWILDALSAIGRVFQESKVFKCMFACLRVVGFAHVFNAVGIVLNFLGGCNAL